MDSSWKLVWSDEFDGKGLPDGAKWACEEGFIRNHEKQFYTRGRTENARLEGGNLILEARREDFRNARITSASLTTQGKFAFQYGRFEMRAQVPAGLGTWPAFWLLGEDTDAVGWPRCSEIDIMEHVGFDPGAIHGTLHQIGPDK